MYNLEPITLLRKNDKKNFIPKITIIGLLVTFLSEYIRHNRKLSIIFNFRFNMYDKKNLKSVTSHDLDSPSPCHKLSHLLRPPSFPSSMTYFMDGSKSRRLSFLAFLLNHILHCICFKIVYTGNLNILFSTDVILV